MIQSFKHTTFLLAIFALTNLQAQVSSPGMDNLMLSRHAQSFLPRANKSSLDIKLVTREDPPIINAQHTDCKRGDDQI